MRQLASPHYLLLYLLFGLAAAATTDSMLITPAPAPTPAALHMRQAPRPGFVADPFDANAQLASLSQSVQRAEQSAQQAQQSVVQAQQSIAQLQQSVRQAQLSAQQAADSAGRAMQLAQLSVSSALLSASSAFGAQLASASADASKAADERVRVARNDAMLQVQQARAQVAANMAVDPTAGTISTTAFGIALGGAVLGSSVASVLVYYCIVNYRKRRFAERRREAAFAEKQPPSAPAYYDTAPAARPAARRDSLDDVETSIRELIDDNSQVGYAISDYGQGRDPETGQRRSYVARQAVAKSLYKIARVVERDMQAGSGRRMSTGQNFDKVQRVELRDSFDVNPFETAMRVPVVPIARQDVAGPRNLRGDSSTLPS